MSHLRKVYICDATGNPIGSLNGALNVHNAGVHYYPINDSFHQHTATSTTLSVATTIGATSITVVSSTGIVAGDYLQFISASYIESTYTKVLSVVGNVININRPIGSVHPIGETIAKIIIDISNSVGSMASPQSYKITPASGQIWHIERLSLQMSHSAAGYIDSFGGIAALTNGCIIRKYNGNGTFATFTVWQSNADIFTDFTNIQFVDRAGGGTTYGTLGVGSFADIGVTVKLDGTLGEYLEILVQDDITALSLFQLKAQGHLETA
jgi:hypothetical protein